ncbi:MAG: DUF3189 family protein [Peptococcaceae bacterium]|nr:DUF3189 family protein [Peptococcaceae bacterium]
MKRILYFSDSRFPLAGLAGAIHTGLLPAEREPGGSELWSLPFLNSKKSGGVEIIHLGRDGRGVEVYALSVKGELDMVRRLVESFLDVFNIPAGELDLVDTGAGESLTLRAGFFLCRLRFFAPMGRFLVSAGVKKIYSRLARLVLDAGAGPADLP